jgi:glycosyltransferase involved in cell wall biosynthesis
VAVHQLVPTLEPGAVGGHILEVQKLTREMGVGGEIFAEHLSMAPGVGRDFRDYGRGVKPQPGDVLLYHVAIGSSVADFAAARRETLVVDHHNITPASWFAAWEPAVVHGVAWGRNQLASLADRTALGIADSGYNERELVDLGYRRTTVVPILLDASDFDAEVDEAALDRLTTDDDVWLFVSRLAPNKCQHDLVKAFAAHQQAYGSRARLRLVYGSSVERYERAMFDLIDALGLRDRVEMVGRVTEGEKMAHFRAADVYVSASEHEGFSVTLVEAMHHGVPVVAYGSTAVPETLGDGGLCLPGKAPLVLAAAVERVARDRALRDAMVAAGHRRVRDFDLSVTRARMADALSSVL